jgi:hypothetical protein
VSLDRSKSGAEISWREGLLVTLAYLAITLFMTYPLILNFDRMAGEHGDFLIFVWDKWWLRRALATEAYDFYFTPYMFHPYGTSILFHSIIWPDAIVSLLVGPLIGEIATHNALTILYLVMCGVGAFALTRYLGARKGSAFIGGLIYAFYPHHMSNVRSNPLFINVQWLPFYALFLIRATREKKVWPAILAGCFLALTGLSNWHLLVMAVMLTAVWGAYSLLRERDTWGWHSIWNFSLMAAVTGVVTGPFLFPMIRFFLEGGQMESILAIQDSIYQTDVLAYFLPSRLHPIFGPWVSPFYDRYFIRHWHWQAFPGYTVLALLGYTLLRRRYRSTAFWALSGVGFLVLALGPYLRIAGRLVEGLPLPYQGLPFLQAMRAPDRFNAVLALPVCVLATGALSELVAKTERRWKRPIVQWGLAAVGCLVLFEYLAIPFPTLLPPISPFYETLREEAGDFAIADVPTGWGASRYYIYYQTVHQHPIVEGHVSRPVGDTYRSLQLAPFLTRVGEYYGDWDLDLPDVSRQLGGLADANVRYVIVHKDQIKKEEHLTAWIDWITLRPRYEDEQLIVYSTRPEYGRDFEWKYDLGTEVGIIRSALPVEDEVSQGSVFEVEIRWGSRKAPAQGLAVELALVSEENGQVMQRTHWPIREEWPTIQWPAGTVVIDEYRFQVDPRIPGGVYSVRASLLDSESLTPVGRRVNLGSVVIHELPRNFDLPEPASVLDISFGEDLRLVGYDLALSSEDLTLVLHWQALRQMDSVCKFFVHVYDPQSDRVVAQADVMPRNWTYPTNWWAEGEYVEDTIDVSLAGVPAGDFQIAVGVYDPDTGARLLTTTGADRVILPDGVDR